MSGVDFFNDTAAINPFMDNSIPVSISAATNEHNDIREALETAGVTVHQVTPPEGCQDGVYTANWGLERNNTVVLARLPNARKGEEAYARSVFESLGKTVIEVPGNFRFSGQGDALPCGELLFCGQTYRADPEAQTFAAETLGFTKIQLETIPQLDAYGEPVINEHSGWPDSFFYDIDLALAVIRPPEGTSKGIIAWCPDAFTLESQQILRNLDAVDKIEVSIEEATKAFALNLVSTGDTVIMNYGAPLLQRALEEQGLQVTLLSNSELAKGGGSIRCTSVCISNT